VSVSGASGGLFGEPLPQVVAPSPQGLPVIGIDHGSGAGRGEDRMIDDEHEHSSGSGDPSRLRHEPCRILEVLQDENGGHTVNGPVTDERDLRQTSHDRRRRRPCYRGKAG